MKKVSFYTRFDITDKYRIVEIKERAFIYVEMTNSNRGDSWDWGWIRMQGSRRLLIRF